MSGLTASFIVLLICRPLSAAWVPLGPFGGAASVVAGDPHSPQTFVAGTRNALLFRSRDAGQTWESLSFPAQLHATLNALVIDPQREGGYLAGLSSDRPEYSGVLRSTDSGATWRQVPGLRNQHVRAIAFKRADSKIVAAGTDSGVFLSQDNGVTWSRISDPENRQLSPITALAFDSNDSSILYAGTPHLPWKTSDAGASWQSVHSGMLDDSDLFSIQVDRNRPQRVFAAACSGTYRSLNGGMTWTRLTSTADASHRTYVVAQDPQHENVWFAGTTDGIFRSPDGGTTWEKVAAFTTRSITFDMGRLGRILIATDQAGILRSQDGGRTWQAINRGFCNRRLAAWPAKLMPPKAPGKAADTPKWKTCPSAQCGDVYDVVSTRDRLVAATTFGLQASDDLGASWGALRGELESDTIQAICRHPAKPEVLFAAKYAVIYRSNDGGRTWTKISEQPEPVSSVKKLMIVPGQPDRIFLLTPQQGVWMLPLDSGSPTRLAAN
jgi:photosystem II stability/assembly factor-like uncharacterized protein